MRTDERTTLIVETSEPGNRLDRWLQHRFPHISRGAFQRLIAQAHLRVNGRPVKATHAPRAGETITIAWPPPEPAEARPQPLPLEVLYEDAHLLVVNKAAGMPVHPSLGHEVGTLVNALLYHCAGNLSGIGGVARPGIVHRLDLDTSGCLVVAKDDPTHLDLSGQFAGRDVEKLYVALVCGHPLPEAGDIRAAIARHPTHRKRMAVAESLGREAWTSYRTLERLQDSALVEARLHTGRTHQIRVHFKHIRCPLVGDTTYGKRQNLRLQEEHGFAAPRQMLHAWRLAFQHPQTGQRLRFEAPWPEDFRNTLEQLRERPTGRVTARGYRGTADPANARG
jgi:23S rRNA pseudouridine1911/1915/1917 synthase